MNSDLKILSEEVLVDVPITVFHLSGWLDAQGELTLLETARTAHDGGSQYLLIDMNDLDTLTSAGMRALQKVYLMFTPRENQPRVAHLKLCNAPPQIYNVLGVTGFLQQIPMYESLEAALETFGKE
jgi:anti-anti-sigma factor